MKKRMTFEQASETLDSILLELSDENTPLEQSLTLYAQAAELIAFCNDTLKNAQVRLEEIDAKFAPSMQNAEDEE